ncbi:hypothetical protein DBR06_SOUSAS2910101, partial [Sousa chinensis]
NESSTGRALTDALKNPRAGKRHADFGWRECGRDPGHRRLDPHAAPCEHCRGLCSTHPGTGFLLQGNGDLERPPAPKCLKQMKPFSQQPQNTGVAAASESPGRGVTQTGVRTLKGHGERKGAGHAEGLLGCTSCCPKHLTQSMALYQCYRF